MQLRCHFLARGPIEVLPRCYYSVSELFKLVTALNDTACKLGVTEIAPPLASLTPHSIHTRCHNPYPKEVCTLKRHLNVFIDTSRHSHEVSQVILQSLGGVIEVPMQCYMFTRPLHLIKTRKRFSLFSTSLLTTGYIHELATIWHRCDEKQNSNNIKLPRFIRSRDMHGLLFFCLNYSKTCKQTPISIWSSR